MATLPDDEIFEDEPMLAVAKQLPTFGGFYFNDSDQIVVALTDVSDLSRAIPLIQPWLGSHKPTGGFVARQVEHTFLDLARYRTVLGRSVFSVTGVVTLGVSEEDNRVEIGLAEPSALSAVKTMLSDVGVPEQAVLFPFTPYPQRTSHTLTGSMGSKIKGGYQIVGGGICTLGFPALRVADHDSVFVVNSHCTTTVHGYDGRYDHAADLDQPERHRT